MDFRSRHNITFHPNNLVMRPVVVMIIDDNFPVLHLYQTLLATESYQVKTIPSLDSYLEWEDHTPFDVLITEFEVGGLETLPLIKEVKGRYPQTHVILATKYDLSDGAYASLLEIGVDDVLIKPFSVKIFMASIQKGLRSRRLQSDASSLR